jgi:uncharacterized delta-60 repeat protein
MKKLIILLIFAVISATAFSQWVANYSPSPLLDNNLSNAKGLAISVDSQGFCYVTGYCNQGMTGNDIMLIKYDFDGNFIWSKTYNGTENNDDIGTGVCTDNSGNIYVVGSARNTGKYYDLVLLKYNPEGNLIWSNIFSGTDNYAEDRGLGIAVDEYDNIYITGFATGLDGKTDIVTQKYNPGGVRLWSKTEDGNEQLNSQGLGIAVDRMQNIYITGFTSSTLGGADIALIKYNSAGVKDWIKIYNGSGNSEDKAFGIAVDQTDKVIITGFATNATIDCITLKYDNSGNLIWFSSFNGQSNGEDKAFGIAVDQYDNIYIAGNSNNSATGFDYRTIKYSGDGQLLWTNTYNGTGSGPDKANAIGLMYNTNGAVASVVVTGESWGTNNDYDFATVRYNPSNGSQISVSRYSMTPTTDDKAKDIAIEDNKIYITGYSEMIIENGRVSSYSTTQMLKYSEYSELNSDLNNPKKFSLYQNFPNPFNPETNIRFDLNNSAFVTLTVYDILGKEVSVLINQNLEAGTHNITFSSNSLPSGTYFYKISAGEKTEIRKMVLIK